nr:unnamed protein product [Digitaria exilis]
MGKNQAYKAMQRSRLGSSSGAPGAADAPEDGMVGHIAIVGGWGISARRHPPQKNKELWLTRAVADGRFISFSRVACGAPGEPQQDAYCHLGGVQKEAEEHTDGLVFQ